ncbi:hypothetical protein HDU67_000479 [Dinochytrium kinnereticum]|nr:hypothetical protein HDU67_000479 [Dinochytrium kinnereticum]
MLKAHRRMQRKRELKKVGEGCNGSPCNKLAQNKESRKKTQLVATSKKEIQDLFAELAKFDNLEKAGPLDRSMMLRREAIEEKLAKINETRKQQGMPALAIPTAGRSAMPAQGQSQFYPSAHNPYGISNLAEQEDDGQDSSDDSSSGSENVDVPEEGEGHGGRIYSNSIVDEMGLEEEPKADDFSWMEVPDGEPPNDSQIYHNLELKEIKIVREEPPEVKRLPQKPPPMQQGYPMQHPNFMPGMYMPQPNMGAYPPYGMMQPPPQFYPGNYMMQPPMQPPIHPTGMTMPYQPNMPPPVAMRPPAVMSDGKAPAPAVISAEPKIRDLQKELTHLVPAALVKRRKAGNAPPPGRAVSASSVSQKLSGSRMAVDAAPDIEIDESAVKAPDDYSQFLSSLE